MKLMVFMMMINSLTIVTMMMILMMIQIIILEMILMMIFIPILKKFLYKVAKASSKRVPGLGTSTGHKPIIDQSYGAVFFFRVELIEIYPPVGFPGLYDGSKG